MAIFYTILYKNVMNLTIYNVFLHAISHYNENKLLEINYWQAIVALLNNYIKFVDTRNTICVWKIADCSNNMRPRSLKMNRHVAYTLRHRTNA